MKAKLVQSRDTLSAYEEKLIDYHTDGVVTGYSHKFLGCFWGVCCNRNLIPN